MSTFLFSALQDGAVIDFASLSDQIVFDRAALTAAQVELSVGASGRDLTVTIGGKQFTLAGLPLHSLRPDAFVFADGSQLLMQNPAADYAVVPWAAGGSGADLLVGSAAHAPLALASVTLAGSGSAVLAAPASLSADGRHLAMWSQASDLVTGDSNASADYFVRDLASGSTQRVSVAADGGQVSGNLPFSSVVLSGDARWVAFTSSSNTLGGGNAGTPDVFIKDLASGAVRLVSVAADGVNSGNGVSNGLVDLSADGRMVAFRSSSTDLVAGDTTANDELFVKDMLTGALYRVGVRDGVESNSSIFDGALSANGRQVAFSDGGSNLIAGDDGLFSDVVWRDLDTGALLNASVDATGGMANGTSYIRALSGDGRKVLFESEASDLVAGDTNGVLGLFLRDLDTGTTVAVDVSAAGELANGALASSSAELSADGRWVVFTSTATNLTDDALAPGSQHVYVKDLLTGLVQLVSRGDDGLLPTAAGGPTISADGSRIAFVAVGPQSLDPGIDAPAGSVQTYVVANPLYRQVLSGGAGDDRYVVANARDAIVEQADAGTDTVQSSITWTLGANLERLVLSGSASIDGTGNALNNVLTGNAGDNRLDGGDGTDTASYATAEEGVVVGLDLAGVAQDTGAAGVDTLVSIENLVGSAHDDALVGDDGANLLDGGAGADWLIGGAGNDIYVVDQAGDQLAEDPGAGTDTVRTTVSWTLAAEFETLQLLGARNLNATGNAAANVLIGNAGSNRLDGAGGADTASYASARNGVVVGLDRAGPQNTGSGIDTLVSIENLTGSGFDDTLHGSAGNNAINGGAGSDTLSYARAGGAITVSLGVAGAQATGGAGSDTVANIENLLGSGFDDNLAGSAAANRIDGGAGNDTMGGGAGNDSYVVDAAGDLVVESAGGGTDTVHASRNWALGAELENLVLTGSADLNATGNALANVLTGNAGHNVLNGGAGSDTASFAANSGFASVDLAAGSATGAGGSDTLVSIENAIGSAFNDLLVGNAANNILTGGAGFDVIVTGAGIDTVVLSSLVGHDQVDDFTSGADRVRLSMAALRIGDGDTVVDSSSTSPGPGGFSAATELVVLTGDVAGTVADAAAVAAAIGSATEAYAVGAQRLFAVDDGADAALYRFVALDADAQVESFELTLVARFIGTPGLASGDILFGA